MNNARYFLTDEQRAILVALHSTRQERRHADRIKASLLLDEELSRGETAHILLIDDTTVRNYLAVCNIEDVESL